MSSIAWPLVIADLLHVYSQSALSRRVDVPLGTLRGWMQGMHEPAHSAGERIIEEWVIQTGLSRYDLPREVRAMSAADARREPRRQ